MSAAFVVWEFSPDVLTVIRGTIRGTIEGALTDVGNIHLFT